VEERFESDRGECEGELTEWRLQRRSLRGMSLWWIETLLTVSVVSVEVP